jgi:WD40 repeat protein
MELFTLSHTGVVMSVAFSTDGRRVATASRDGTVGVWNASDGSLIRRFDYKPGGTETWLEWVALSADGRRVAACANSKNSNARAWDVDDGRELFPPLVHQDGVSSIEFSPGGRYLVTASWDTTVRIWDANTGRAVNPPIKQSGKATYACFSSDSRRLLTVCYDGFVTVWDLPFGEAAPSPTTRYYCPDGLRYLTRRPLFLDVHDAVSHRLVGSVPAPADARLPPLFDRSGQLVVTFSVVTNQDARPFLGIQTWRVSDGTSNGPLIRTALDLTNAVLSVDGRHLALQARRRAECWDTRSGRPLGAFPLITGTAQIVFNHRGDRIAIGQKENTDIVDVQSGRVLLKAPMTPSLQTGNDMRVASLEFSPDDRQLVVAYSNSSFDRGAAQVWNVEDGTPAGPIMKQRDGVTEARFSPYGRHIVTASEDFDAILWDSQTSAPLPVPPLHHEHQVFAAAFSDDSRWVVTGGRDRAIRIWETQSGEPLTLPVHFSTGVAEARFVAGGRQVLVRCYDGTEWLWDLPQEKRTIEELRIIAQVLSGRRATRTSSGVLQLEDVLWESWQQFRNNSSSKTAPTGPTDRREGSRPN